MDVGVFLDLRVLLNRSHRIKMVSFAPKHCNVVLVSLWVISKPLSIDHDKKSRF